MNFLHALRHKRAALCECGLRPTLIGVLILATSHFTQPLFAQTDTTNAPGGIGVDPEDVEMRARFHGALVYTKLDAVFDDKPAPDVLAWLSEQIDVPVIGRFVGDDRIGDGMNPGATITLRMPNATALAVLEQIVAQCEQQGFEPCTWQIRRGFIEVGTKARLSVPAARERRIYDISEQMMQIPNFKSGGGSDRSMPIIFGLHAVQTVVETVEPGAWDFGQPLEPQDSDNELRPTKPHYQPKPSSSSNSPAPRAAATSRSPGRYVVTPKPARIRLFRQFLIIDAPDYIHRQIDGYPDPIPPRDHDETRH